MATSINKRNKQTKRYTSAFTFHEIIKQRTIGRQTDATERYQPQTGVRQRQSSNVAEGRLRRSKCPITQSLAHSVRQSDSQSFGQSTMRSAGQPVNRPVSQSVHQLVYLRILLLSIHKVSRTSE